MVLRFSRFCLICCVLGVIFASLVNAQNVSHGLLAGSVTDATGAVLSDVMVTMEGPAGEHLTAHTSADGWFQFAHLAPGEYTVGVQARGFERFRATVRIGVSGEVELPVRLAVAHSSQTVSVEANRVRVETAATESGLTLDSRQVRDVPLNGRSVTDLLALQPGVVPETSAQPNAVEMSGVASTPPSGGLDPGALSVVGQRETANSFRVNGADAQEDVNMGAAIVPALDSIAELSVTTNNTDAALGGAGGGQILVTTRSGSEAWHGSLFNYFRNTALDARNFFSLTRASYHQNQFGGALGGPVVRGRVFFFADYQGTRQTQGIDTGEIPVPTAAERAGDFSGGSFLTGSVSQPYWAQVLSERLGYAVTQGEPYSSAGCTSTAECVFPKAVIPARAWSGAAQHLLAAIPQPNVNGSDFSTAASPEITRDDKGSLRLDTTGRFGALMAYYFFDDYRVNNPYPTAQGGANVPGFNALNFGRAQLLALSDTKAVGAGSVNVARFSYLRNAAHVGQPVGGLGPSPAEQGIAGVYPVLPAIEGTENVIFNDLTFGIDVTALIQAENIVEAADDFSHTAGKHDLRFGFDVHGDQINNHPNVYPNGSFTFTGSETGTDFADFLLGIDSNYTQGQGRDFYNRDRLLGAYAQDSWRLRSSLTVNYGLRWDVLPPWHEKYNQLETLVPGESSVVFPGAPTGLVFPGDPGVPRTLAPTRYDDFGPRVGLAWSPAAKSGWLARLTGQPGTTSVHAAFGEYYIPTEGLSPGVMSGNPPYGFTYTTAVPTLLDQPFTSSQTGASLGQRFPLPALPYGATATHPIRGINWAQYEPVTGIPAFANTNVSPYAEDYSLTVERALGDNAVLRLGYVGTQGHHLLVLEEANPGDPALCLSLSQPQDVAAGSPTCGPFGESGAYLRANGEVVNGTRGPLGANFDSDSYQRTIGNSHDNALEVSLRHSSRSLYLQLSYTWSKSIDQSSSLTEAVDPVDPAESRAISAFDLTHNFVASYRYAPELDRWLGTAHRFAAGWQISGLTRLSTGFPVTLVNDQDTSLLGTQPNGVNDFGVDQLQYTPGNLERNSNPFRHDGAAFNASLFSLPPLGQFGNARRRFFYGPGLNNTDLALEKSTAVTGKQQVVFRMEAFNVFNHAQFFGPAAVNGSISSSGFGQIQNAAPPRLMQASVRYRF